MAGRAYLFFMLILFKNKVVKTTNNTQNCYEAMRKCRNSTSCSKKLDEYTQACGTIADTSSTAIQFPCSPTCVMAIKTLMQHPKGKAMWECDCKLDADCITLKKRTEKCLAMANGTYIERKSCTLALSRCNHNAECSQRETKVLIECSTLFSEHAKCSNTCLSSQRRLFTFKEGKTLRDCECDGPDEIFCHGFRAYADAMKCNWYRNKLRRRLQRCLNRKEDPPETCAKRHAIS